MNGSGIPEDVQSVVNVALAKIRQACLDANRDLDQIGYSGYEILFAALWANNPKSACGFLEFDVPIAETTEGTGTVGSSFTFDAETETLLPSSQTIRVQAGVNAAAFSAGECCMPGKAYKVIQRPGYPPQLYCLDAPNC